jgi:hypothetical protein
VPVEGGDAHFGPPGDALERCLGAVLIECLIGYFDQPVVVAVGVGAETVTNGVTRVGTLQ